MIARDARQGNPHDWVVRLFRGWAAELDELVRFARTGEAPAGMEPTGESGRLPVVLRRLNDRLAVLLHEAERHDEMFGAGGLDDIRYALVVLADEMLLAADWPGRRAWLHEPLELRLYGTQKAGEEIFTRMDALLRGDGGDRPHLALSYLLLLSLGFRGSQSAPAGRERLAHLRGRLFQALARRTPEAARLLDNTITPEAYRNVLGETRARQMPYLRPWLAAGTVGGMVYLTVAWVLWRTATAPILDLIVTLRHMVGGT